MLFNLDEFPIINSFSYPEHRGAGRHLAHSVSQLREQLILIQFGV